MWSPQPVPVSRGLMRCLHALRSGDWHAQAVPPLTHETPTAPHAANFSDVGCIKLAVSKLLSYLIITGAFILKVPQIMKILQSKSVKGLPYSTFYLETLALVTSVANSYVRGYALSTFGENIVITVQNFIIVSLMWVYNPVGAAHIALVLSGFAGVWYGCVTHLPLEYLDMLPLVGVALTVTGRVPAIIANFTAGHTGQWSVITQLLQTAGGVARVFTTLQEVPNVFVLAGYVTSASLNGIILLQILFMGGEKKASAAAPPAAVLPRKPRSKSSKDK